VTNELNICIGYDKRELNAYRVCLASLRELSSKPISIIALMMDSLQENGLYTRPHEVRNGQLWDMISDAPMSTEFAITRFLVPYLRRYKGWCLFCDCDFMFRADVAELFALRDESKAVMVVKHCYSQEAGMKMDRQQQTVYARKNWSSLVLWNCGHSANWILTPDYVNGQTGKDLHQFTWLTDDLIGELPFNWNWIELQPKAVHFTAGTPDMKGHEYSAYSEEYREWLKKLKIT
jgi:hypothetical protein